MPRNPRSPSDRLKKHLGVLTRSGPASEAEVQTALHEVLAARRGEVLLQHQTGDGPCDLFLPARRVVIEVKERGAAGPERPGSQPGETQYEQVQRYVLALRERERRNSPVAAAASDVPWIGALTDGVRWWAWKWPAAGDGADGIPHAPLHEQQFERSPDALVAACRALAERSAGKPWVPADPAELFRPLRDRLDGIWGLRDGESAETQVRLWRDLVRGSGIEVADERRDSLFLDHCLLVTLARYVSRSLDGAAYEPPTDGFIAWLSDAPGGMQWSRELFAVVERYDWGAREADVLRNVYMAIVPKADRKLYGEYYTPDWLAHLIVEETLDDDWLDEAIRAAHQADAPPAGMGVLDPTCGSGTFLFHAARRILAAIPRCLPSADAATRARIASHLVHGIDIHPVAVEMARATLRRALPAPAEPSVHQGDALLMSDTATPGLTGHLFNPDESEFASPDGRHRFHVPHSFTDLPDFVARLNHLVQAACDGAALPASVTLGMDEDDTAWVSDAHASLIRIIEDHGDSVWAWYIRNQLMPRAIARRKVNRIVANPPWLRWNEIQTSPRKENVRALAEKRQIMPATQGGASSFDIGGLFVVETREVFLTEPTDDPSAFVLNAAALRSENWRLFREHGHLDGPMDLTERHLDGKVLRRRPFGGAEACVIGMPYLDPCRLVLNDPDAQIAPTDDRIPPGAAAIIPAIEELEWSQSSYALAARNGTTIGPAVLARIDPRDPSRTLQPTKAKPPWSQFQPFELDDIPDHWRVSYADPDNLAPFAILHPLAQGVIPNESGQLLSDDEARKRSASWRRLSDTYQRHAPKGATTPQNLAAKLNYRKQLETQWPPGLSVVYNKSGSNLRAAVATAIVENKLYRVPVPSEAEGHYLCALLNAPALAFAYRFARKSGRHFDKTPLEKVPIPSYNPENGGHRRLAELAAAIAAAVQSDPEREYPGTFAGELREIDGIAARMLPDFARSAEEDDR